MDNTEGNKSINAAATRKRRSSILKSQRPPRTPFSELEFKVATPSDTAKSRRVSFSRRTGVAEFVTNEATTTWKNFYEENNKSLESSGNESAANAQKPMTIVQIGRSIFEQQFDGVVAVDIGDTIVPTNTRQDFQTSLNNGNYPQQVPALECTGERLTLPQQNFELSALTDHQSKLFGNDITCAGMTEMTNPMSVNFSVMQALGGKCDDLDEIEQNMKRAQQNVICPGPVYSGNISEYIEVLEEEDLNMTHVGLKNDEYDMSITDTVCSPKVQEVPKKSLNKKSIAEFNLEDKENLAVNPYAPILESDNFAVNEELDKVLVFDGKRLTVQTEKKVIHSKAETQPRKTIVSNTNDDLPNFATPITKLNHDTVKYSEENLSMTQALEGKIDIPRRQTIVFENDTCNLSMTQAIPAKVIVAPAPMISHEDKQKTIVYEDDSISFTQALPANLIPNKQHERTVHFNSSDLSFTQAMPQNIVQAKRQTICNEVDISITQAIPTNILTNKENDGKTVLYDNDIDISMTQAVPQNIILSQNYSDNHKTVVFDDNNCDISITEALPPKAILPILENVLIAACDGTERETIDTTQKENNLNKTQVKNQDISMTQALPPNIILSKQNNDETKHEYDQNMSTTQVLPNRLLMDNEELSYKKPIEKEEMIEPDEGKIHKQVIKETCNDMINKTYDDKCDLGNLSLTKPIPGDILTIKTDLDKTHENKTFTKPEKQMCEQQDIIVYQSIECKTDAKEKEPYRDETEKGKVTETVSCKNSDASLNEQDYFDKNDDNPKEAITNMTKELKVESNVDVKEENNELADKIISGTTSITSHSSLKPKKSILNELLDMSNASLDHSDEEKNFMAVVESPMKVEDVKSNTSSKSGVFIIRRDSNCETTELAYVQADEKIETLDKPQIKSHIPALEYKEEDCVSDLNDKIDELKAATKNIHYEEAINAEVNSEDKLCKKSNISRGSKSLSAADDTRELLQMLSEFTDRRSLPPIIDEPETEYDGHDEKVQIDSNKSSFANRRPTLSREDLLNNISMAQAALQQSRFDVDSDSVEETDDSPNEVIAVEKSGRRSLRISSDVVKALQFDETASDINAELETSPLKKTAFGETSYMKETKHEKVKVIPTYDVSDGIKELMSDLVKPLADVLPFESGVEKPKNTPSTVSTQIQANLITSSQIDLDVELHSNTESVISIKKDLALMDEIARLGDRAVSTILKNSVGPVSLDVSMEEVHQPEQKPERCLVREQKTPRNNQSIPGQIIYFDQHNPLNNVLISPMDYENAHPYNPIKSHETLVPEKRSVQFSDSKENKTEVERVTTQYNVDVQNLPSGDACIDKKENEKSEDIKSITSNTSKPLSIDRSTEGIAADLKDTEINTEIAMKKNKELLEANSSLTLVDDALARSTFDVDIDSRPFSEDELTSKQSAIRVIYKMDKNGVLTEKIESNDVIDLTSNEEEFYEDIQSAKGRKRSYSPTKQEKNKPTVDVTPKQVSKIQKISRSPSVSDKEKSPKKAISEKQSPKKTRSSPKNRKPSVTIQQLLTEYNIVDVDRKTISDEVDHAIKNVMSIDSEMKESIQTVTSYSTDVITEATESVPNLKAYESEMSPDWPQETLSQESSKNFFGECDSSSNVVAKLNMLPFMGTPDCEWESSTGDVWSFLLLRSRVRACFRLAHSYLNAPRSRVTADTPVLGVVVDSARDEDKEPLVALCVRLAAEAMRLECARSCRGAGDVPAALARCRRVARAALRWLRAMRDAMCRLAFALTADGCLTLKVANVPLRSVWELSMKIELIVEDAQETAWPKAGSIGITTIVADEMIPVETLCRVAKSVPHDWGHAPRTIWKLFKFLKHKMRDEDLCGLTILNTLKCH
ncbi:uncharacterized protein LOC119839303 [Zerene cesonia]|uniref:uncharacterized protein LOC119839303 n=1 Tax=Zerene cesonia TaxID=33412 RepID=UPI0018E584E8|nr:uncharacterized protein LOC119839303 [Zerene cesonia]